MWTGLFVLQKFLPHFLHGLAAKARRTMKNKSGVSVLCFSVRGIEISASPKLHNSQERNGH